MANSFVRYTGNGSNRAYAINFSYRSTDDLSTLVAGSAVTAYVLDSAGTTLTFDVAPANGAAIEIRRTTSQTAKLVDYVSGSVLTENDLDTDSDQSFYMSQEALDKAGDVIVLDSADFNWDGQSKRLKNIATPVDNTDAVNKAYISTNIPNITTVAGISANVTAVAGISSDVTAVAGISTDVSAVENIKANVTTVAGVASDVTTVAGISADVAAVENIAANVTTVAGISANVTSVAGISSEISAVNANATNINTVAGANTNITNVGGAITNINTVATNLASVNAFGEQYRISSSAPTTSLTIGDLYFDTTANELKVYKSSGWAAAGSTVNGTSARYNYTATAGQTTFTGSDTLGNTLAYDAGFADVYLNGVRLSASDITITSGTSVVLATGATVGDVLDIVAYGTFNVAAVDGSAINSGTINEARLPSTVLNSNIDLTNLSGTNITSGTVANARLTGSGAITINGSPVSLGGSVTVGETKPTVSSISPTTISNAQATITITGANFTSIPQVEFLNPSTGIWYNPTSVTFNNSTSLTVVVTLTVDAQYKIRIENGDGNAVLTGTLLTVSDAPTWSTGASLGTFAGDFSGTLATLSASSDSTIAYSETTSVLSGAGITLNTSTGALTTTDFGGASTAATTYTFTIRATDAESQTADRTFTISS
ncbi:phage tail fiber protein, partial [Candidatus Pelagibacter sp.]|nr:phage tail fiber protein [Candidatus Pelagibacter sp.]